METVDLQLLHQGIIELKQELVSLKECFHEDFLELSEKTKLDIEESRQQIQEGKFVRLEEL